MKVTILGSGSKGNATLLDFDNTKILIDIGFSYNELRLRLNSINVDPNSIDYIFITHDHIDHILGLNTFISKHKPYIYINDKIAFKYFGEQTYENIKYFTKEISINNIFIKILPTSHDSINSNGFLIEYQDTSIVYITDTGYIHRNILKNLVNKDYYIIESNHDIEMLMNGKYPHHLQRRILSNIGHLSNNLCGSYLASLIGPRTKKIILAHLSEENNTPELAKETVKRIINNNIIKIECAHQSKILEVIK